MLPVEQIFFLHFIARHYPDAQPGFGSGGHEDAPLSVGAYFFVEIIKFALQMLLERNDKIYIFVAFDKIIFRTSLQESKIFN